MLERELSIYWHPRLRQLCSVRRLCIQLRQPKLFLLLIEGKGLRIMKASSFNYGDYSAKMRICYVINAVCEIKQILQLRQMPIGHEQQNMNLQKQGN